MVKHIALDLFDNSRYCLTKNPSYKLTLQYFHNILDKATINFDVLGYPHQYLLERLVTKHENGKVMLVVDTVLWPHYVVDKSNYISGFEFILFRAGAPCGLAIDRQNRQGYGS